MSYRKALLIVVATGLLCTAGSFFAQYVMKLNPCPLCILQRVAVISVTLMSILVLLLPAHKKGGWFAAAVLISIPALWGLGVAGYQIWLQSLPVMERPSCGAPWTFRLKDWPLFDVWEPVVRGFGDCGVQEHVMGVPLPIWSVMFFGSVLIWVWFAPRLSK
ncbi:disulfide bond formation protein DsbB [Neisseria wadsworthii 9715]|uniref:Disulfide bond formation protein DsbB n=2 Tax=Neisseria TaxID=482 RepID=G4CSS5_9NEIS|nr:disulfide bond formation protein B [Neisseria wadsworthii]EGZ44631.1 disulfide bond formation protein DsbB [Neisseria wadsworthii 9715]QMT36726.1 disulfide bond formation protein B [Neisseria wadsworthii]